MSKFDINSFIGTPNVMKNAVRSIDIDKLIPYKNHCFKLYEGERLDDMVRSVQNYGIMVPIIVRNVPGSDTYEILSGHNRVNAAKIAGKKNVPALVKENLPDEFAELYLVEKMAKQLREISASYASPSEDIIAEVLNGTYGAEKKPVKEKGEKVTIPKATYSRYLGSYSKKEANLIIEKALAYYFENNEEETA